MVRAIDVEDRGGSLHRIVEVIGDRRPAYYFTCVVRIALKKPQLLQISVWRIGPFEEPLIITYAFK